MTAEYLTRRMGPLSSIMHAGNLACKFVDSLGRFLNLYGRLYGPYNLPYHGTNLKIGQVNRQIYQVPHLHDARLWSHSSS